MRLNDAGWMLSVVWRQIPDCYPGAAVDEYVIMPNHIHGIILLIHDTSVGAGPCACPSEAPCACPDTGQPQGVAPTKISLGDVVGRFKCLTSRKYIAGIRKHGWPPFAGRLWQRNYYEHIIRNEDDFTEIREYIIANPSKWSEDREYTPL